MMSARNPQDILYEKVANKVDDISAPVCTQTRALIIDAPAAMTPFVDTLKWI